MTKRADGKFPRRKRDTYDTPPEALIPLLPFLRSYSAFAEPMCGEGAIIRVLEARGWSCTLASDIEPRGPMTRWAFTADVLSLKPEALQPVADVIVSNPPWPAKHQRGEPTVGIIRHLSNILPTWLLLSADFAHNGYAAPLLKFCPEIVSVGRVSWMGNNQAGFDNAAWYLFDQARAGPPRFHGFEHVDPIWHPDIAEVI